MSDPLPPTLSSRSQVSSVGFGAHRVYGFKEWGLELRVCNLESCLTNKPGALLCNKQQICHCELDTLRWGCLHVKRVGVCLCRRTT